MVFGNSWGSVSVSKLMEEKNGKGEVIVLLYNIDPVLN
jgi:hypothetical protein